MGGAKTEWMAVQERGWSAPETFVCADCVEDPYLKELIKGAVCANTCDYCDRHDITGIATSAEVVIQAIYDAVHTYYCEPAAGGVPYDHGFVIKPIGIDHVLYNLGFDGHPDFVQAVVDAEVNGDHFVPAADGYWAGSHPHEVLSFGWRSFVHTVKHETRFHFSEGPQADVMSPYEIDVREVLPAIAFRLRPLIRNLTAGTQVYRARVRRRGQAWQPTAKEMGAPPKEVASAGRMNPAGIPYLYTAFERSTARLEAGITGRTSHTFFIATFLLSAPLQVIDLTLLPAVPSLFDLANKEAREQALFIRAFVDAISVPVTKDGSEHIDYVPTQVICEYLAQIFEPTPGTRLGGLIYPSTLQAGGKNLVVFPEDRYVGSYQGVIFAGAGK